ncbi:hypothetical protein KP509_15G001800 [Ceratopteris richardii]|uniref:Hexosyltransferase n=1 Tax=Ceratopteris richardii TaxID=49495 RepID=A0A8T2T487_CERRI|nr:hypothetical protein KP509_15G001800 [Ceratopteris richardii]
MLRNSRRFRGNMPSRRTSAGQQTAGVRSSGLRLSVISLLLISVAAPLLFLTGRLANLAPSLDTDDAQGSSIKTNEDEKRLRALQKIEQSFPSEVIKVIETTTDDSGPLSLNVKNRNDLSSSWVLEKLANARLDRSKRGEERWPDHTASRIPRREALDIQGRDEGDFQATSDMNTGAGQGEDDSEKVSRQQSRLERKMKRTAMLTQGILENDGNIEQVISRRDGIDDNLLRKYNIWRQDNDYPDALIRIMKDQLIMGRVYLSLASSQGETELSLELTRRTKEIRQALGQANLDSELSPSVSEKVKAMGIILSKAREQLYDCKSVIKKLRAMLQGSEDHSRSLHKQSAVLRQLVAKTIPKGLHCLSLWLMAEYNLLPEEKKNFGGQEKLEDTSLYHYALFSDNVIATAVVINSTVYNAKDSEFHVFHIVTDKLNYPAMKMWFLSNPPGKATIEVQKIEDFKWLNSSYCPVLRQLQTATAQEYYFKADHPATIAVASNNLKYRNPKYLSMLNHLRFYLPEVYPKLDKILFLDDDIVVQSDLTPLWSVDLRGNVNGAVETCGESFHRFDKYLNFSNPSISENFDPNACGWAYGMNIFDLQEWKERNMTGVYHRWQSMNEQRDLWKLGTLPPGLITFYNSTYPLDKHWHLLGLGYDGNIEAEDIGAAAVIHYNGNMKPWLDLAMEKYKSYWTRYLDLGHPFLQRCNIHL